MFTVCPKRLVAETVTAKDATHLISMLDPGDRVRRPRRIPIRNHLELWFEDEEDPDHRNAPQIHHCMRILEFGNTLPSDSVTVVHCFAGVCRSTASALALFIQRHGIESAWHARQWLREDRPQALPNMLMANHFDTLLNCNGKFIDLCERINESRVFDIRDSVDW